jgi:hypothetical protein
MIEARFCWWRRSKLAGESLIVQAERGEGAVGADDVGGEERVGAIAMGGGDWGLALESGLSKRPPIWLWHRRMAVLRAGWWILLGGKRRLMRGWGEQRIAMHARGGHESAVVGGHGGKGRRGNFCDRRSQEGSLAVSGRPVATGRAVLRPLRYACL